MPCLILKVFFWLLFLGLLYVFYTFPSIICSRPPKLHLLKSQWGNILWQWTSSAKTKTILDKLRQLFSLPLANYILPGTFCRYYVLLRANTCIFLWTVLICFPRDLIDMKTRTAYLTSFCFLGSAFPNKVVNGLLSSCYNFFLVVSMSVVYKHIHTIYLYECHI